MEMLKPPVSAACLCCSRCRPLHLELRGARDAAKPPGRRVSVAWDLLAVQATWRPTSWICNRVTGALTGACVAALARMVSFHAQARMRGRQPCSYLRVAN